jgi:predicted AlkP superfamily pyrophosphatase or phosphodiesterase
MIQTCYSKPHDLYGKLSKQLGRPFRLRHYWGPTASEKVGDWIEEATSAIIEAPGLSPDLCMTYLPTLDYALQRENPSNGKKVARAKTRLESQISRLVQKATSHGYRILIYGDYRMAPVDGAVLPNLALRQAGLLRARAVNKMTYPDMYGSRAFSMVDHEIAHVYISDEKDIPRAKATLEELPGVYKVLDHKGQVEVGLDHQRSGELLAIAREGKWFAYPWWSQKREAPDYAGHVDIHNKPGYDPCELFFGWPPGSVSHNTGRVGGSHGRVGPGREVFCASDLPFEKKPENLIDLAVLVRRWLNEDW